ncbi:MAG: parvulin peptidyl-prolyl isomerase [Gammaproteobacteria bacterium]|nr:MAG: parvulin peptidyl-prolyl isomerase [Gammaproteobacteria bacterium]
MLHFIRERAQGWVAWFIVGLITIPFALWGVNSYITAPSDNIIATVNGESIKQGEYQRSLQSYRDQMRARMGDAFDPSLFDSMTVKESILDELINKKLLLSAGFDLGQRVSNDQLNRMIQSTPAFQKDGQFDSERYAIMLARIGLTPERYESELRMDSAIQELTANVKQSTLVSDAAVNNLLRLENQQREIAYGVIPALALVDTISVEAGEIETYYDEHTVNYLSPERVTVDYVELSIDELSKAIEVTDADLQSFYVDNEELFFGPEQRKASHILIEGDDVAARATLEQIKTRLAQGELFADLAIELSQDVGSAKQGGDVGFFQRDVMDVAFEKAAFSLVNEGDVSDIVKTEFGHHLIQLTAVTSAKGKGFVEVKSEVESLYRNQQAENEFFEKADQLANLSFENPDDLDITAEELNLEVKTSTSFLRQGNTSGSGIAANRKIVMAAFSEDVLVNNLNSAVIELGKTHLVVLHKNKHTPASQLPFESVSPAIMEQLRFEKAIALATEQGDAILERMKVGENPMMLFAENNWNEAVFYSRDSDELSQQVLERVFSMAKPSVNEAEYLSFIATNGNYIAVKLSAIRDGQNDATDEQRDGLASHLARTYSDSELQAFIESVRDEATVEVFNKYL